MFLFSDFGNAAGSSMEIERINREVEDIIQLPPEPSPPSIPWVILILGGFINNENPVSFTDFKGNYNNWKLMNLFPLLYFLILLLHE